MSSEGTKNTQDHLLSPHKLGRCQSIYIPLPVVPRPLEVMQTSKALIYPRRQHIALLGINIAYRQLLALLGTNMALQEAHNLLRRQYSPAGNSQLCRHQYRPIGNSYSSEASMQPRRHNITLLSIHHVPAANHNSPKGNNNNFIAKSEQFSYKQLIQIASKSCQTQGHYQLNKNLERGGLYQLEKPTINNYVYKYNNPSTLLLRFTETCCKWGINLTYLFC